MSFMVWKVLCLLPKPLLLVLLFFLNGRAHLDDPRSLPMISLVSCPIHPARARSLPLAVRFLP
jgi:hypothetical protein